MLYSFIVMGIQMYSRFEQEGLVVFWIVDAIHLSSNQKTTSNLTTIHLYSVMGWETGFRFLLYVCIVVFGAIKKP